MKYFKYDGNKKQQGEVMLYAYHEDLYSASEKELQEFLLLLSRHIPKGTNAWGGEEPKSTTPIFSAWLQAQTNVVRIIKEKQDNKKHRYTLLVSFLALCVALYSALPNSTCDHKEASHTESNSTLNK